MPATSTIPKHFEQRRNDYLQVFNEHYSVLGPKALNQLTRGVESPRNIFWDCLIWTYLHTPDHYIPLSGSKELVRRSDTFTTEFLSYGQAGAQQGAQFFANPLRFGVGEDRHGWSLPSLRVAPAPILYLTVEYDYSSNWDCSEEEKGAVTEFLETQLGWCRAKGKKDTDCAIGEVYQSLREFADFVGLCVTYGGHKSCHIHIAIRTDLLWRQSTVCDPLTVRECYREAWWMVADRVHSILNAPVAPDASLQYPETFRRLPNGLFVNDKPSHIMGVPLHVLLPQVIIYEKVAKRARKGATELFMKPTWLRPPSSRRHPSQNNYHVTLGDMPAELHLYCQEKLARMIEEQTQGGYPKLNALDYQGGVWKAKLHASADDKHAECLIEQDHRTILVRGQHEPPHDVELPYTLGELLILWRDKFEGRESVLDQDDAEEILQVQRSASRVERDEERELRERTQTRDDVAGVLSEITKRVVSKHRNVFIVAPEGCGKSRGIMANHPSIMAMIEAEHERQSVRTGAPPNSLTHSMFSYSCYDLAKEKVREFMGMHPHATYFPVVLRSFTDEYKQACRTCEVKPLDMSDIDANGFNSRIDAIKHLQPQVIGRLQRRHEAFWRYLRRERKSPVFFTVHQVMQLWTGDSITRTYWHPQFWESSPEDFHRLKSDMKLALAVHDEISWQHLMWHHPAAVVEHVKKYFSKKWRRATTRSAKFKIFHTQRPHDEISFDDCLVVDDRDYARSDFYVIDGKESYDGRRDTDQSLYAARHGAPWYAKPKQWWEGLADRVVVTTTEALPTAMVHALNGRMVKPQNRFEVFEFDLTHLIADSVQLRLMRGVTSAGVTKAIQKFRLQLGEDVVVVTNCSKHLPGTISHLSARGSNALARPVLAQAVLHISPDEYEALSVVNQVFRLSEAVRLNHLDQFNQACGRNMGFRNPGGHRHYVLMSPTLYEKLHEHLVEQSRYGITVYMDADARSRSRRRGQALDAPANGEAMLLAA